MHQPSETWAKPFGGRAVHPAAANVATDMERARDLTVVKGGAKAETWGDAPAQRQHALRALHEHHELIINAAGEGIYGLDLRGCATFVNPAAAALTGHEVDELIGRPMHDMVHHTHQGGSAYHHRACPIYATLKDGQVHSVSNEVFWRKDGSCFPVQYTGTPIIRRGQIVGAVVVFRDITDRKCAEAQLREALEEVQALKEKLHLENRYLRERIRHVQSTTAIVGRSPALEATLNLVRRAAPTDVTVLIEGESGTGKELVARAIHDLSARAAGPLVKLNCAALSPYLVESELFGHEKGAFTGASHRRAGRFEAAAQGTLFLDEVGELPLETQAKLLRVLQEHEFERVGSSQSLSANVRVVAATNRDLRALVAAGRFRADLYYRLAVMTIPLPPLRQRREDIPALAEHFIRAAEAKFQRRFHGLTDDSLKRACAYHWPGNIRELENAIERAAVVADEPYLTLPAWGAHDDAGLLARPPGVDLAPTQPSSDLGEELQAVERQRILEALRAKKWRISGRNSAAAVLGMHPNTLRYRMQKLNIQRPL